MLHGYKNPSNGIYQTSESSRIVPHARTLRKAREQVKYMVEDGASRRQIRKYLVRWLCWWVRASNTWKKEQIAQWYLQTCWEQTAAIIAADSFEPYLTSLRIQAGCEILAA